MKKGLLLLALILVLTLVGCQSQMDVNRETDLVGLDLQGTVKSIEQRAYYDNSLSAVGLRDYADFAFKDEFEDMDIDLSGLEDTLNLNTTLDGTYYFGHISVAANTDLEFTKEGYISSRLDYAYDQAQRVNAYTYDTMGYYLSVVEENLTNEATYTVKFDEKDGLAVARGGSLKAEMFIPEYDVTVKSTYDYNKDGQLTLREEASDTFSYTIEMTYDDQGRAETFTYKDVDENESLINFVYDDDLYVGYKQGVPGYEQSTYFIFETFDDQNNWTEATVYVDGTYAGNITRTYTYY